ncbi:MAG: hypothetical protein NWF05_03120 [Candidatus Bathyarchaeota archaeon]|nr:hypothetical protein [Candidatus Bathyarchaeota archaeon]
MSVLINLAVNTWKLEIPFYNVRPWDATMLLYHYKPDMLVVAKFLGYKDLENTRLYI